MKINFVFDIFKNLRPYWNLCDISADRLEEQVGHEILDMRPAKMGWWYLGPDDILSTNNQSQHTINYLKTSDIIIPKPNRNIEYNINPDELYIYPIFVNDKFSFCIPQLRWLPKIIADMVNKDLLHLVILNFFEPDWAENSSAYWNLTDSAKECGITKLDNLHFATNDFKKGDKLFIDQTRPIIHHMSLNAWEFINLNLIKKNTCDVESTFSSNKTHIYLFQNGSPRTWRYLTYKSLEHLGIINDGLVSYLPTTAHRPHEYTLLIDKFDGRHKNFSFCTKETVLQNLDNLPKFKQFIDENPRITSKTLPNCPLDPQNILETATIVDQSWLNNTYFSVVCESQFDERFGIISEKTFKMIYYGHPFIIIGSAGVLKELKRLGYETFPELFNESYDEMVASVEKIQFICQQISYWCKPENKELLHNKFQSVKEKILHNRKLFLSRDHYDMWIKFKN